MTRVPLLFPICAVLALAASAPARPVGDTLNGELERARAEQAQAETQTRRLEQLAAAARSDAARFQAQQAAAAQAIEAAEARITAADTNLRLIGALAELRRTQLQREQQPIASLLAGLVLMAQRPPLFAIADQGGADELVRVKILLDSTLPVIRRRTFGLSSALAEGKRLEAQAVAAKDELVRSRQELSARRSRFAALEAVAAKRSVTAQGDALASGDVALAAGENVASLRSGEAAKRSAWAIASDLAANDPAPLRPTLPDGAARAPLSYVLPADAAVTRGLGSVSVNGVRSRGIELATGRGAPLRVPASGVVKFAGPFESHDGVVIIDHGGGWMSLIVNVGTQLKPGDRVGIGQPLGRALGTIEVELSQNGRRASPALIAGSSQTLSNAREGG